MQILPKILPSFPDIANLQIKRKNSFLCPLDQSSGSFKSFQNQSKQKMNIKMLNKRHKKNLYSVDQIMKLSGYTINFDRNMQSNLPPISSMQAANELLIPSPIYLEYQRISAHQGNYKSLIDDLTNDIEKIKYTHKPASKENYSKLSPNLRKATKKGKTSSESLFNHDSPMRMNREQKISLRSTTKWNLKVFFDALAEKNEQALQKQKEREEILKKLNKINSKCRQLQRNGEVHKNIAAFAKFSRDLNKKLIKKQRRISKIKNYQT